MAYISRITLHDYKIGKTALSVFNVGDSGFHPNHLGFQNYIISVGSAKFANGRFVYDSHTYKTSISNWEALRSLCYYDEHQK